MTHYIDHNGVESDTVPVYPGQQKRRWPWQRLKAFEVNNEPSLTQNSHHDATDINLIMARFKRDGYFPPNNTHPQYADVTGLQGDLTAMIEKSKGTIRTAEQFAQNWKPPVPAAAPTSAESPSPTPANPPTA